MRSSYNLSDSAGHRVRPTLRTLEEKDLPVSVALHREHLGHEFFARLGPRYLRVYYGTFRESPDARALVAEIDGAPVAVLVGTTSNLAHYEWVVRRRTRQLAVSGIVGLATRPRLLVHFVRTRVLRYLRGLRRLRAPAVRSPPTAEAPTDVAVLMHIVVHRDARRRGLASALVREFADSAQAAGASRIELVTLAPPNGAGPFYERLGWTREGAGSTMDGDALVRYRLELHDIDPKIDDNA